MAISSVRVPLELLGPESHHPAFAGKAGFFLPRTIVKYEANFARIVLVTIDDHQ